MFKYYSFIAIFIEYIYSFLHTMLENSINT